MLKCYPEFWSSVKDNGMQKAFQYYRLVGSSCLVTLKSVEKSESGVKTEI